LRKIFASISDSWLVTNSIRQWTIAYSIST